MPNIMKHLTQTGGIQEDEYTHLYNSYISGIKEKIMGMMLLKVHMKLRKSFKKQLK